MADDLPPFKETKRERRKRTMTAFARLVRNARQNGRTIADCAKIVGISTRQASRWQSDPAYIEAYDAAFRPDFSGAGEASESLLTDIVEENAAIMRDKEAPATARVAAGRLLLDAALKLDDRNLQTRELEELRSMVAEIQRERAREQSE